VTLAAVTERYFRGAFYLMCVLKIYYIYNCKQPMVNVFVITHANDEFYFLANYKNL